MCMYGERGCLKTVKRMNVGHGYPESPVDNFDA